MGSYTGNNLNISVFGQSHSKGIGVTIDGIPAGEKIDFEKLQTFLNRRAPGKNDFSTKRKEDDRPEFLSGFVNDTSCGAPISAVIYNKDPHSGDYKNIADCPRPGHADFTAQVKYRGYQDVAGGGHFSGRLTAPVCIAGGILKQVLERKGIKIFAHISSIGNVSDASIDRVNPSVEDLEKVQNKDFPVISNENGEKMKQLILAAKEDANSIGGTIECVVVGIPCGLGDPMFDGMENLISKTVFGIPAIKGIEFGNGFDCSTLLGSQNNDEFYYDGEIVKTKTNNHGGILGGITSGMPLIFKVAVKPTPSIGKEQNTISFSNEKDEKLVIKGRHDPCIVQRAVPCIESAAAIAIYDAYLANKNNK